MIQMTTDFSTETMEKWHNIFQGLKEKSSQNFISSENTFQKWRWNKDILRWRKVKFAARRPALKELPKSVLQKKGNDTKWQLGTSTMRKEQVYFVVWKFPCPPPLSFIGNTLFISFFSRLTEITNLVNHCLNTVQTTQDCFIVHTRTGKR